MKKLKLKKWVKVVMTLLVIHITFFIWRNTGTLGSLANYNDFYLVLCWLAWAYLLIGQVLVYKTIWEH